MEHVRGEERPVSAGKEADEYQRTFYIGSTGDRRAIRRRRLRANGVQLQKVVRGFTACSQDACVSLKLVAVLVCCCCCCFFPLKYLLTCD